jgi:dephospho-CoA kinase
MKIFVVVGMPASGKNIARIYAESKGIPYYATGDLVRQEVERRGLQSNAENVACVSTEMRGEDGRGVTRKALATALKAGSDAVFLEGMRSWPEIEMIRAHVETVVVAFVAPRQVRLDRIISRGRADDSAQAFDARDTREIDYGTAVPIALADHYVLNTESMEKALADVERIVKKRPA